MSYPHPPAAGAFVLVMGIQLVVFALALVGLWLADIPVSLLGARGWSASLSGAFGAALTFAAALWITRSDSRAGTELRRHCAALRSLFAPFTWPQIVLAAAAAGVCEELLFRGFLQSWLLQWSTPAAGILCASIVFALLHAASLTYFSATLVVGLLLGVSYWLTHSLLLVITWHGLYDLLAIAALAKWPQLLRLRVY